MINLLLPEVYDSKKLKEAMEELYKKAAERSKGQEMSPCVGVNSFEDSFNGFMNKNSIFVLTYHYNIGDKTYAVCGHFNIL